MSDLSFTPRTLEDLSKDWPTQIEHLSASSLGMAWRCPEQYRRRYILGEKVPPAQALLWGAADHGAIAYNYGEKLRTGSDAPIADVLLQFVHALDERIEEAGGPDGVDWEGGSRDQLIQRGTPLVAMFREQVCPEWMPTEIESEFELTEGMPLPVQGRIDVIASRHDRQKDEIVPDTERIIERKSASRTLSKVNPDWQVQRRVYQLARKLPHELQVSIKTQTPKIQLAAPLDPVGLLKPVLTDVEAANTRRLVGQTAARIAFYYTTYGPDVPWEGVGQAHPWACGFCGYRPTCPWWAT